MTSRTTEHALAEYRERWNRHEATRAAAADWSRRLSSLRGATFLVAVAALIAFDFFDGAGEIAALAALAATVVAFVGQVVVHRRIGRRERWSAALAGVAREGVLRLERRWEDLEAALPEAERVPVPVPHDHPYASDLDVAGRASLFRLLGPVTSKRGRDTLATWLLHTGSCPEARQRQDSVRELAPHAELRAEVTAHGRLEAPDTLGSLEPFLTWAEAEPVMLRHPVLRWAGFVLPVALLSTVLLDVTLAAGPWWLLPAALQLWVVRRARPLVGPSFTPTAPAAAPLRALVPQLRVLDRTSWESAELRRVRDALGYGPDAAHRGLGRLTRILDTVESRHNLVYAALAPVLLLDLHVGWALDRWRARHGPQVRRWLDAAAEWEAVSALGTLAHDHPRWAFPELAAEESPVVRARSLGHPLLDPERCVTNDVAIGPPGSFLLVTGSNMSGKSTLLRAVGLNAVLAGAGGPVAADEAHLPCMRVFTSMRVDDSLEEGVSLFMAELLRIRGVVEAARTPDPEGRPVLYLLDEMLHGTNTAERRVAARGVVQHLLAANAVGAVSTHDLLLAETPELQAAANAVHFREHIEGRGPDGRPRITFDYRLRPGIATTRNALKLLAAVGLDLPDASSGDARERGSDADA
ncbi:MAG: hypothetical protein U5R14_03750 [Gemmatimonadota bacterium]|nr:hypothetical protein [Gemmatimonadota bacterium]